MLFFFLLVRQFFFVSPARPVGKFISLLLPRHVGKLIFHLPLICPTHGCLYIIYVTNKPTFNLFTEAAIKNKIQDIRVSSAVEGKGIIFFSYPLKISKDNKKTPISFFHLTEAHTIFIMVLNIIFIVSIIKANSPKLLANQKSVIFWII